MAKKSRPPAKQRHSKSSVLKTEQGPSSGTKAAPLLCKGCRKPIVPMKPRQKYHKSCGNRERQKRWRRRARKAIAIQGKGTP